MNETADGINRNEYLFHHLIAMFQTLALQQLGKLINPITQKLERDLQQARITIDMLQMLRDKTSGNLTDMERRLLDNVIMELQMNYVDELPREGEPEAEATAGSEQAAEPSRESAGGDTEGAGTEPQPAAEPAQEAKPAPEAGPAPETVPSPDAKPSPEAEPAPKAKVKKRRAGKSVSRAKKKKKKATKQRKKKDQ